jgi:hypothetical protein
MTDENLAAAFEQQMFADYHEATDVCGYPATRWLQMLQRYGGVGAAKRLPQSPVAASGFVRLWERNRLDLTAEYRATEPSWRSLFTPLERAEAQRRLDDLRSGKPRRAS